MQTTKLVLRVFGGMVLAMALLGCAHSQKAKEQAEAEKKQWEKLQEALEKERNENITLRRKILALEASKKEGLRPQESVQESIAHIPTEKLLPPKVDSQEEEPSDLLDNHDESESLIRAQNDAMPIYYRAKGFLDQNKLEDSIAGFESFIKEAPEHVYADRAAYHLIEAYYRNHEYSLALQSANRFESKYPWSFQIPSALYFKALSLLELGEVDLSKQTLKEILKKKPTQEVVRRVSIKLAEISVLKNSPKNAVPLLGD